MKILKDWINISREWEFDSMSEPERKNLSMNYLDKLEKDKNLDLYLIADDDEQVYFMILNDSKCEEAMLDHFMGSYGCTTAWYWSRKNNNWRML
jgi:hypothetical protein